ncbi:AlpA family transcriptional regulator [Halomonas sp. TRM85114]|uniref:helix-turn-helix transcriptional regulator n=1 Tax=Halomonas jincaotanensis TaxID=2810616 RepID=UPI001BD37FAA|nr:AlpA family transcriptional regulator [Halomonas jincaotanensis]MBS9404816.1 AlpA family transcriptional regulator [Halomonas jincaotanensis]
MSKRLIKKEIVLDKTSLSKSSLYRLIKAGKFPPPVPLTGRAVAWLESEIDEWIDYQVNARCYLSELS